MPSYGAKVPWRDIDRMVRAFREEEKEAAKDHKKFGSEEIEI